MKIGVLLAVYLQLSCLVLIGLACLLGNDLFYMEWNCVLVVILFTYAMGRWKMKKFSPPKSALAFFTREKLILTAAATVIAPLAISLFPANKLLFVPVWLTHLGVASLLYSD
jgi:hypothetical protein